jgi:glutamyl-Q tRNA(Asp) synthetase
VGRFAPTPSGDLHLGSLFAAAASYLEARARGGRWLLRMEDLDGPRAVPGAADRILRTLEAFGFEWDGPVTRQSQRTEFYRDALDALARRGLTFACTCSRSQLENEPRYPGTCRSRSARLDANAATRLRVRDERISFLDGIQGEYAQHLEHNVGDFILRRRDGIYAYVLAVVVDDAAQGVNHVIRGADLLEQTPRQLYLIEQLQLAVPGYAHVPLLLEPNGTKLAKSARSVRIEAQFALPQLVSVFGLLGMAAFIPLQLRTVSEAWAWAIQNWNIQNVPKRLNLQLMS